jgi:hypothetical protein
MGIRVYLRDSQGLNGPYTILTRWWGKTGTITATSTTFAERQAGIPYHDLVFDI